MDTYAQTVRSRDTHTRDGATPARVRNHNERLVLSVVKDRGPLASSQIARLTSLSAQTASVITRSLEADGLLLRGSPARQRGKVGKPSTPVSLRPQGAFAFGLRIGRRAADMILMNLAGQTVDSRTLPYDYPLPDTIDAFAERSIASMADALDPALRQHIVGIGIATPFGLWKLPDEAGAPKGSMTSWQSYDFATNFSQFTDLEVFTANDASMACSGEFMFGNVENFTEFVYFFVGAFVGGGLVLGGRVYFGRNGNAAAFGSLPIDHIDANPNQLVQGASIYVLERALSERTGQRVKLRDDSTAWDLDDPLVAHWVKQTARSLAVGSVAVSATVDVATIMIDGNFPLQIKQAIQASMENALDVLDTSEIERPQVFLGTLGRSAAAVGAAYQPIMAAHFVEGSQIRATL